MNSFRLKSYLTFLGRNKLYTAINLFGLAVSLSVIILLALYVKGELAVDNFHKDADRIYRLSNELSNIFSSPVARDLKTRYPDDVETVARMGEREETIWVDRQVLKAKSFLVDSSFFSIFSFPLLEGDPGGQLRAMDEVTVSRSFANKVFGEGSALGKSFRLGSMDMVVTGVMKDISNSHFQNPDLLLRFEHAAAGMNLEKYDNINWRIFAKQTVGGDIASRMPDFLDYYKGWFWAYQDGIVKEMYVTPLRECYFVDQAYSAGMFRSESRGFISVLIAAMLAILMFAVINYVNLSVAQSGFRAREAATRRLLGSSRAGLVAGFITESMIFCAGAFVVGVILASIVEPAFNKLLQTNISIADALTAANMAWAAGVVVVLGIICGTAPALAISQHKPIEVVRGSLTRKTKMVYSRVLITLQYCITIVLLGSVFTIMLQTRYMRTTELGFDKHNIIQMDKMVDDDKLPGLRDQLMNVPGVEAVSFCTGTPAGRNESATVQIIDGKQTMCRVFRVDSLYFDMLGIEVIRRTGITDKDAIWLNETAMREMGLASDAVSYVSKFNDVEEVMQIAGVVKDFHFRNFTEKIAPAVIARSDGDMFGMGVGTIMVKISSADPAKTYQQVRQACLDFNGEVPFGSEFVDAQIDSWYDGQQRTYTIIGSFAVIAILIAALGMLAMATYYLRQRTAEIAIRKVFGSTDGEVLRKVILSFMRMVLVAFVIAVPVIWYAMNRWLEGYAYHISLSWTIFALAGLVAFAVALLAVFWQSWKATTANPVDSLKR